MGAPKDREGLIELRARALARVENQRQLDEGVAWPVEFEKDEDGMEADWKSWLPDATATLEAEEAAGLAVVLASPDAGMLGAGYKAVRQYGLETVWSGCLLGIAEKLIAASPYAKREA